jgi:hypothetical protein
MDTLSKYTLPSFKVMCLMAFINETGETSFSRQSVYKNKTSFKAAVKYMIKINAIKKEQSKIYPFSCFYDLTESGKVFINGLKK